MSDTIKSKIRSPNKAKLKVYINLKAQMNGNMVNIEVYGINTVGLVDSEAAASCISAKFFRNIYNKKLRVDRSKISNIYGVGGEGIAVKGQVVLPLKFNNITISQSFLIIENIQYPLILGNDFLCENQANINYPTRTLYLHDGLAQVALVSTFDNEAKTQRQVVLPAGQMSLISVRIPKTL